MQNWEEMLTSGSCRLRHPTEMGRSDGSWSFLGKNILFPNSNLSLPQPSSSAPRSHSPHSQRSVPTNPVHQDTSVNLGVNVSNCVCWPAGRSHKQHSSKFKQPALGGQMCTLSCNSSISRLDPSAKSCVRERHSAQHTAHMPKLRKFLLR